eukprot:TRINITY_DN355_c0_g1_i1.p1 TRINITY_DN355_c0_g1~~TRINITY_DN355_c0_g1_i1.p1  ORF type:complete len:278 (+),score=84.75 TRINITY_DN355_c0_g1_i1:116-949(+)
MIHHPFLVGLDYVFQTPINIYFVMKYYKGGELYKHLTDRKCFPEVEVMFYGAQIALALGELHKKGVIYRDMKPENILLDEDGYVALADFGLAKMIEQDKTAMTFCGTPEYMAPEIIREVGYDRTVDWWGLGILLYEMLTGQPPFYSNNRHVMFQYICTKELSFPASKPKTPISKAARDIIAKLLAKKPEKRLGHKSDVEEVLSDPFFSSVDVKQLLSKKVVPMYKPKVEKIEVVNTKSVKDIETIDIKGLRIIKNNEVLLSFLSYRTRLMAFRWGRK